MEHGYDNAQKDITSMKPQILSPVLGVEYF